MDQVTELASKIKVLLMDVDGVFTDGKIFFVPGPDGATVETKGFDSQDGIALHWMHWYGIRVGVISGRNSPAVVERARQLKFTYVYQGHIEKVPILEEIMADAKVTKDEVAFVGDDFTDVILFSRVGLAIATGNARPEVKAMAHYVTNAPGGQGAIRELCELILQAQGHWPKILEKYGIQA